MKTEQEIYEIAEAELYRIFKESLKDRYSDFDLSLIKDIYTFAYRKGWNDCSTAIDELSK